MASPQKILQIGDPRLRQKAEPVNPAIPNIKGQMQTLVASMLEFQRIHGWGRAMAAPQIGLPYRMVALNFSAHPFVMINPEITWRSPEKVMVWDDCMSLPSITAQVERHRSISVEFVDENFETHQMLELDLVLSEVIQHECDHLEGVLFVDLISDPSTIRHRAFKP